MALKVIEGGGPRGPDDIAVRLAVQAMRTLTIELLRSLARGQDRELRVIIALGNLSKLLTTAGIDGETIVRTFLDEARKELTVAEMSDRDSDDADREIEHILLASLQVAAEKLALDDAAAGRASQREHRLSNCLEAWLRGMERRSRAGGGSYVKEFLKANFARRKSKWDDVQ